VFCAPTAPKITFRNSRFRRRDDECGDRLRARSWIGLWRHASTHSPRADLTHRPMILSRRAIAQLASSAVAATAAFCLPAAPALGIDAGTTSGGGGASVGSPSSAGVPSGGASIVGGGLAPTRSAPAKVPPAPSKHAKGSWLTRVTVTEYWPAPESWFVGRFVKAPGLPGLHRVDWLYSATGVSMEGDGIGLDGRRYHIDSLGDGGWVTSDGASTSPSDGWSAGSPYWRAGGYWRNRSRAVTFPLGTGGWSNGRGSKYVPLPAVTFAAGESLPLRYYQSIAVDPGVIPLGSRVYVPAYRNDGHGGWFIAQDTGGAINGHHIDVFRSPPASAADSGQYLTSQRIFVIKPKR
jgi:3D (Asp-Asp-Asp) domain-containing protein